MRDISALYRLPHTSQCFVIELQIFCRGEIGLRFVGTLACRTLADFLSRLTAFQLRSPPCYKRRLFTWLSRQFLIGWGTREPRQIVLFYRTLADKARQDVLRSSTVRYRPTSPDLVADLPEFAASLRAQFHPKVSTCNSSFINEIALLCHV